MFFSGLKARVQEHFWKFAMPQLRSGTLKHILLIKASHIAKPKGNRVEIYTLPTGRLCRVSGQRVWMCTSIAGAEEELGMIKTKEMG